MGVTKLSAFRRIALLPRKIFERGFWWFVAKLFEIFGSYGTKIFDGFRRLVFKVVPFASYFAKDVQVVQYDLNVYPISYDICWYLALADLERKKRNRSHLHCVFVPVEDHENRAYPPGYDAVVDQTSRRWQFQNICIPATSLIPACEGFTVCNTRAQVKALELLAPGHWPRANSTSQHPALSAIYQQLMNCLQGNTSDWGLRAPEQGLRYMKRWLEERARGRKPVVVTLRQYAVDVERNSNVADWIAFLTGLDQAQYLPILVPDTDCAVEVDRRFDLLTQCTEAAWNLGLRMALYESAYINMFVNSGPASLCVLNPRCRYLLFKITVPGVHLVSEGTLREMGFEPGDTPVFATPYQRWVWDEDRYSVICREFDAMVQRIEDPARSTQSASARAGRM